MGGQKAPEVLCVRIFSFLALRADATPWLKLVQLKLTCKSDLSQSNTLTAAETPEQAQKHPNLEAFGKRVIGNQRTSMCLSLTFTHFLGTLDTYDLFTRLLSLDSNEEGRWPLIKSSFVLTGPVSWREMIQGHLGFFSGKSLKKGWICICCYVNCICCFGGRSSGRRVWCQITAAVTLADGAHRASYIAPRWASIMQLLNCAYFLRWGPSANAGS